MVVVPSLKDVYPMVHVLEYQVPITFQFLNLTLVGVNLWHVEFQLWMMYEKLYSFLVAILRVILKFFCLYLLMLFID